MDLTQVLQIFRRVLARVDLNQINQIGAVGHRLVPRVQDTRRFLTQPLTVADEGGRGVQVFRTIGLRRLHALEQSAALRIARIGRWSEFWSASHLVFLLFENAHRG